MSSSSICPHTLSFTYFQLHTKTDKGDQTGFDIILEKHLNGKFAMKDMMEFFRERYQPGIYTVVMFNHMIIGNLPDSPA